MLDKPPQPKTQEYVVPLNQRIPQLKICLGIAAPVLLLMASINYSESHTTLAWVEIIVLFLLLLPPLFVPASLMVREPFYVDLSEWMLLTGSAIIFIMLLQDGGVAGTGILWIPLFAFEAFHLRGIREGWLWIAGTTCAAFLWLGYHGSVYSTKELWMFVPAYAFYVCLAYLINRFRLQNAALLDEKVRERTAKLEYLAMHDPLTGLHNRHSLQEHLNRSLHNLEPSPISVLIINCNRFQEINNLLGHENGDLLLKQMANRIESYADNHGHLGARLAADEFALVLHSQAPFADANGLKKLLEEPYSIGQDHVEIETRMGLATFPQHGKDADELLRHADIALRTARTLKKSPVIYQEKQNPYNRRRLELFGHLRSALRNNELVLFYQPKIELASGRVVAVEALVRWQHPTDGMIPPNEFIGIAEESGLMRPMSQWILKHAIAQQRTWMQQGTDVSIGVNLSMLDLTDTGFPKAVRELLGGDEEVARQMTLEVTETSFMNFPDIARSVIIELEHLGFRISIDDYGTGYSSLSYLQHLPVQELKIDQCFVMRMTRDDKSAAIVRSTIELAHSLGMQAVAEGVETADTAQALREFGCDLGQGFFFARPMPAEEFAAFYRQPPRPEGDTHEQD